MILYECVISYEQRLLRAIPERHQEIETRRLDKEQRRRELEALKSEHASLLSAGDTPSFASAVSRFLLRRRLRADILLEEVADQRANDRLESARGDLEWVYEELTQVRLWLDAFVAAARAYSAVRPGLRRTPEPEPPPSNVRIYPSSDDYVAENPARALGGWSDKRLGGSDVGYDWAWYDYERPWIETKWCLGYIEELGELYAVQRIPDTRADYSWDAKPERIPSPVWLFDVQLPPSPPSEFLLYPSAISRWLNSLMRELQKRPNSLLALAEAVRIPPDYVMQHTEALSEDLALGDEDV